MLSIIIKFLYLLAVVLFSRPGEKGRVVPKDRPIANFEEVIDFGDDEDDDLMAALGGIPKEKPKKVGIRLSLPMNL